MLAANLVACAHFPENTHLDRYAPDYGYRIAATTGDTDDSTDLMLAVTFSGGGTRAAAFAYGVLETLYDTIIDFDGRPRRLSNEIDVVSSVSGGSVLAAYFALNGERTFATFPDRWLYHDAERDLWLRMLSPRNWLRLTSPYFGRSEVVSEYLDDRLFHGANYRSLIGTGAPATLISATDMALGAQFTFDQDQFDLLCSDLSPFPISRAVAASIAVPVLLSPVTLENYAARGCGYELPRWALQQLARGYETTRRYAAAARLAAYVDVASPSYLHLIDGGLADNLGLRAAIEKGAAAGSLALLLDEVGFRKFRHIVHIVVNAQIEPDLSWDRSAKAPGLFASILSTTTVPLNRYNVETIEAFRDSQDEWLKRLQDLRCARASEPNIQAALQSCADIKSYLIEVSFAQDPDPDERAFLRALPTSLHLSRVAVDRVRTAARTILTRSSVYRRLLSDLTTDSK